MSEKDLKIIEKIRKCLALAQSDNPNEAAIALRQAQALMEKHNIESSDLDLLSIDSAQVSSGAGKHPPIWVYMLIDLIKDAFTVQALMGAERKSYNSSWKGSLEFIGFGSNPEIAQYAYDVLVRQLKKGRTDFIKSLNPKLKPSIKTKRGDMYAMGWVNSVKDKIQILTPTQEQEELIDRWVANKYGVIKYKKTSRTSKKASFADVAAYHQGSEDGNQVQLHQGMGAKKPSAMLLYQYFYEFLQ